tara:strand:+ start:533 stop:823 length:291 start_codon:yes stop_codon:yes gene_type:complete
MGELIDLEKYRENKEHLEDEAAKLELERLQGELKDLINDLEECNEIPSRYNKGYDEIIEYFYQLDEALDGYSETLWVKKPIIEKPELIISMSNFEK